ncbi:MAG: prepilin-type N-terminal cleavage/methylation domain-containing protein [Gemmatimonadaceae bacterium]|nr:prepilin-type N-terminal cleavage/methylation domain-containing protein [Gemmatimonadaceae bacterium]
MAPDAMRRRGFTLIELLCVVLIIGILASIAITKFGDSKRRAYLTAMKTDLRNLASIAEAQFTSDNSYANVVAPQGSDGVTLTFTGTASSWSATATHASVPGMTCSLGNGAGSSSEPDCR